MSLLEAGFRVPQEPRLPWRLLLRSGGTPLPPPYARARRLDFFWGRSAIFHGLRALGLAPGDRVLVPAFHCAALVEPIVRYGGEPQFYGIDRDLAPDWADLEAGLAAGARAVLVVHFFGFPAPIGRLRQLCDAHGAALIEDCAHVLVGEAEGAALGTFGEISVFSWHKFLPMVDGGQLLLNAARAQVAVDWSEPTRELRWAALRGFVRRTLASSSRRT
ncbi:MAG TPA: DegT/DnrJ/EryC1/StrS family aminotransferase, partial [Candidatus Polarisedimenticolaceae bacterium]|nr:DegT/DnrJ/EryC1/StrS family aminotransferase [Candidatus Polarisedimenticolaceae bacterium]